MLPIIPMDELQAVNIMLGMIGEMPVSSLETGVAEANNARDILHNVNREVQTSGLSCNTEENYPLNLDTNGYVNIPQNAQVLRVTDASMDVVQRGTRLYDRENHTYVFRAAPSVDIIMFLDFSELPQDVRQYITVRAGRVFIRNSIGAESLSKLDEEDEQKALIEMRANEERRMGNNMLYSNRSSVLRRGSILGRL